MKQGLFEIIENIPLTENVYKMVMQGDTSAITASGQFVNILLDGLYLRRPISVCDVEGDRLTIIYKVVGKGTKQMSEMRGGKLDVLTGLGNGYDLNLSGDKPVLMGGGVRNVCVVVTRYFGGTLLGTGGLVRAYSASVQEGLKQCILIDKKLARQIKLTSDYSDVGKLQYLIAGRGYTTLNSDFTDHVEITVLVPVDDQVAFEKQITEATAGRVGWEALEETYYAVAEGEILLFDH